MTALRFTVENAALASDMPHTRKLVLLALATLADNVTGVVPPGRRKSLTELARLTSLGRATVARDLDLLDRDGWVVRDRPSLEAARTGVKTGYRIALPSGVVQAVDQVVQEVDQGSPGDGRKREPSEPSVDPSGQKMASRRAHASGASEQRTIPKIIREVRIAVAEAYGMDEEANLSDDEVLGLWAKYAGRDGIRDLTAYMTGIFADAPYLDTFMSATEPVCVTCVQYYENCKCAAALGSAA